MTEPIQTGLFNGAVRPVQVKAKVHTHCMVCGRGLSEAKSIERGVGPVCWGRVQASIKG